MGKVKVELDYNPYIMETTVKFNDRKPFVNSLVERFEHEKLQDWLEGAPGILSDEMNGYDFELEFAGPDMDYNQLKSAFKQPGIPTTVSMFHRNELESRQSKVDEIKAFLAWLQKHNNKNFDYKVFRKQHADIFDDDYTFITIHMQGLNTDYLKGYDISVESLEDATELTAPDELSNTPIFIFVSEDSYQSLANDIQLLKSYNVSDNQLFFIIKSTLQTDMVCRVIQDLGINKPQIVESEADSVVSEYFFAYPVTERIYKAGQVFDGVIDDVKTIIKDEESEVSSSDKELKDEIDELNHRIALLKASYIRLKERDNIEIPDGFTTSLDSLLKGLQSWKKNKIKINPDRAEGFAQDYLISTQYDLNAFVENVNNTFNEVKDLYLREYKQIYKESDYKDHFSADTKYDEIQWSEQFDIKQDLIALKDEQYVEPKADFKDLLLGEDKPRDLVLEITYSCDKWRKHVSELIMPKANAYVEEKYNQLIDITNRTAGQYIEHIDKAINELQDIKSEFVSRLSSNESQLQEDKDWLSTFEDYVDEIERS